MQPTNIYTFATANFTVKVDALEDEYLDLSWDEGGAAAESLERGDSVAFCAYATVLDKDGRVLARDCLSGCIYGSLQEFATAHRDPDPLNRNSSIMRAAKGSNVCICHYFPDMVRGVCQEARETLRKHAAVKVRAA